jgi:uncharacterized lipoprotein YddW (UPF0748 family)
MASLINAETIIIDNNSGDFSVTGSWSTTSASPGYQATNYRYISTALSVSATARWSPVFASEGTYEVSVWYVQGGDRPTDAKYVINHKNGTSTVYVDQTTSGSTWLVLGIYEFLSTGGSVTLSNLSSVADKAVIADAVRFVRNGTAYGDLYQGMWIYGWNTNYGFYSAADTDSMLAHARQNNINCIFPEVRKVGDAHYISATEPRASNIDPSYTDPLADVIAKAHDTSGGKQYIEVHAWIVPYRVWSGGGSKPAGHVLLEHPEWAGRTYEGTISGEYLDPGHPGAQDYIVDVIREIVENYDVDGIHWDYFRYPESGDWGYNPTAVARFNALYGKVDKPDPNDPDFCEFRRHQIEQVSRKAYAAVKAVRWNCKLSAALITWLPSPPGGDFTQTRAYYDTYQDWPAMMSEGSLDLLCPMNYMREHDSAQKAGYRGWTDFTASARAGRHAIIGPGVYLNYIHNTITQMLYAIDTPGIVGLNPYRYLATSADSGENDFWYTVKADVYNQRRNVPDAPWLSSPTQGILRGTVTSNGTDPIEGATVTLSGGAAGSIATDGSGFYAFLKLDPGTEFTATASAPTYSDKSKSFDIQAGVVTTLDFDMSETPTPTPTATPSPTPSPTATATSTPSPTPTLTPTPIPTPTPTLSPTPTPTATPSPSPSPTPTPSPTATATSTPTPTLSSTPTPTPTPWPDTPTPTPSPTPEPISAFTLY